MENDVEQINVQIASGWMVMAHVSTAHLIPENQTTASFAEQTSAPPFNSCGKMVHVSTVVNILGVKEMVASADLMFAQRGKS